MGNFPDCQTNTHAWFEESDKMTKRRFDPTLLLPSDLGRIKPPFFDDLFDQDCLREAIDGRRNACSNHFQLSQWVLSLLTEQDFENKWIELGKVGQEKHIFSACRGLFAQDTFCGFTFTKKYDCPELLHDALMKDNGRGFLELLKEFLLNDHSAPPTRPFILAHPRFDKIIGWDENAKISDRKTWLGIRRLMRTTTVGMK